MEIKKTQNDNELVLALSGSLDNNTSKELDAELNASLDGITSLIFDFSELEYISSAGLRVLVATQKTMQTKGTMVIRGANQSVMDVFVITGFDSIFTIEA